MRGIDPNIYNTFGTLPMYFLIHTGQFLVSTTRDSYYALLFFYFQRKVSNISKFYVLFQATLLKTIQV